MTEVTDKEHGMTSQLNYLIVTQRQAVLVSRAEQARLASEARLPRSASALPQDPTQAGIPFGSLARATLRECT